MMASNKSWVAKVKFSQVINQFEKSAVKEFIFLFNFHDFSNIYCKASYFYPCLNKADDDDDDNLT